MTNSAGSGVKLPGALKLDGADPFGAVSDAELQTTTLRMLGRDALPKAKALSPEEKLLYVVKERGIEALR